VLEDFDLNVTAGQTIAEYRYDGRNYRVTKQTYAEGVPSALAHAYQMFTEADLAPLRAAGYGAPFRPIEQGVPEYVDWLDREATGGALP